MEKKPYTLLYSDLYAYSNLGTVQGTNLYEVLAILNHVFQACALAMM